MHPIGVVVNGATVIQAESDLVEVKTRDVQHRTDGTGVPAKIVFVPRTPERSAATSTAGRRPAG